MIVDEGQREFTVRMLRPGDGSLVSHAAASYLANKTLQTVTLQAQVGKRYALKVRVTSMRTLLLTKMPQAYSFSIEEYEGVVSPKYPLETEVLPEQAAFYPIVSAARL